MKLNARETGGIQIVELSGRFDAHEAPAVAEAIHATVDRPRIVINLAGVNFVDSTGLATLVQAMKRCRERAGDLVLSNLQQPVRIIFELTHLDKAFTIYPAEGEAVASFTA